MPEPGEQEKQGETPAAIAALQATRAREQQEAALKQREQAVVEREAKLKEEGDRAAAQLKEATALAIAASLNVSKDTLLKFTDGSEAAMRELAAQLPKVGATAVVVAPDSGRSTAGSATKAQIMDNYRANPTPETRAAYAAIRGS